MDKIDIIRDSKGSEWFYRWDTKLIYRSLEDALSKTNGIQRSQLP